MKTENEVIYVPLRICSDIYECPKCKCHLRLEEDQAEIIALKHYYENKINKLLEYYK